MHDNQVSIPGMQGWKNQSRLYITKNKLKNKNYMTISIDAGKSFWQNSTSIHDKNSEQSEYGGNIHKHRKGHIWKVHS